MTPLDKAPSVPINDVEWRVDGKPTERKTARFVPYVDATTTATLLDEWVGPGNWSDEYRIVTIAGKEALECALSIKVGDEWVTKRDVGVASNFEAQKGMVSDAFKRVACIKWGVARNVYSLPTLWAPCRVGNDGKAYPDNDKTLPAIHQQLKKLGYEASGRLSASVELEQEGGVAGGTPVSPNPSESDAEVPSAVVAESAQAEPKTTSVEGSGPGAVASPPVPESEGGSTEPSSDSLALIEKAVADKTVKQGAVLSVANRVAMAHSAIPEGGIATKTLQLLPAAVLDEIANELGLKQGALV